MLQRLIIFFASVLGVWTLLAWWRRSANMLPAGETSLSFGEFDKLQKLAKTHPRLDHAIRLRISIVQAAKKRDKAELSQKIDSALRRLGEQITLKRRINEALSTIDRDRLAREAAGARAQAQAADPDDGVHGLATQLELQLEQVDRLTGRQSELDSAADRIVLLLGNLNLALLEAESSKATESSDKVQMVLTHLEEAGDSLRRTTEAEAEVAQMLKAHQATLSDRV